MDRHFKIQLPTSNSYRVSLLLLGGVLLLFGAPPAAHAQVTATYIFDHPGFVRCDNPTSITYDVQLLVTSGTGVTTLTYGYDPDLTYSSTSGDSTTCTNNDTASAVTCTFGSDGGSDVVNQQDLTFTLDAPCSSTPRELVNAATITWSGGSMTAAEKSWAGDNGMDDMVGSSYSCTAGDVKIRQLFIDRADIADGCVSATDDFVTGELIAGVQTNSTERYDIGVWVALDGGDARTGTCATENLYDERIGLMTSGDITTPVPLDPDGDGVYRNLDRPTNVGDDCGDTRSADADANRTFGSRTLSCDDSDSDGFADVAYCVSWQNNANQGDCYFMEDALPNTNSKCWCGIANFPGVAAPQLSCTIDCPSYTQVSPGDSVTCTVAYTNTDGAGTADYVRYKVEDSAPTAGTFSSFSGSRATTVTASHTTQDTYANPSGNTYIWTPYYNTVDTTPLEDYGEHAGGVTRTTTFTYTVGGTATTGAVTVYANTYWYGDNSAWTPESQQALTCSRTWNLGPTWVHVADFDAYRDTGGVVVRWKTATEAGSMGFDLYRRAADGRWNKLNHELLPTIQRTPGAVYRFLDRDAAGQQLEYKLVELDSHGFAHRHGPYTVAPRAAATGYTLMQGDFDARPNQASPATAQRLAAAKAARVTHGQEGGSFDRAKIEVHASGLYKLSIDEIADALGRTERQVEQAMRSEHIAISSGGKAVHWSASDDGKGLVFYAHEVNNAYTNHNVYWLELSAGARMPMLVGYPPEPRTDNATFEDSQHFEQELEPSVYVTTDPTEDYWFWFWVISDSADWNSRSVTFRASGISTERHEAALSLDLWGLDFGDPNGATEVILNGTTIGTLTWSEDGAKSHSMSFNQSLLIEGTNTLEVKGDQGVFWVDGFDVQYQRLYRAVDDYLEVPWSDRPLTITGFSSEQVAVYQVGNDGTVVRIDAVLVDQTPPLPFGQGDDPVYRVTFLPREENASYVAVGELGAFAAVDVRGDVATDLANLNQRADYLILTSGAMVEAAGVLADYRENSGLDTMVVDLEDVMDEFNHGLFSPEAVQAFISRTRSWKVPPRYLALVGKGSYDYKNNLNAGGNIMPAIMAASAEGLVAADNAFADINNDGVPELAVGRIPVLTAAELQDYVAKIRAYENGAAAGWANRVLLLADNPDSSGDFDVDSERIAGVVPNSYYESRMYLGAPATAEQVRQHLLAELHTGALLLSYVGHGGITQLAHEGLLRSSDIDGLDNQERLPMVAALTCYINFFAYPGFTALGEELVLEADGGAAAVWSSSGLAVNPSSVDLGEAFVDELLQGPREAVGDTVRKALQRVAVSGGPQEVRSMYILLGDPAVVLTEAQE